MRKKNHILINPSNSLNLSKPPSFRYQSTPKKKSSPINLYNFNYLTKLPSPYINVFCRLRPINELELLYSKKEALKICSSKHLLLSTQNPIKISEEYIFDEIFEPNIHISSFYNKTCKNIIKHSMQGYNGGIIIYGESGSGKTYIIKEIIPHITRQIYEEIEISDNKNEIFKIEIAIFEIYKEQINDLLNSKSTNLNIIELKNKRIIINDLTYITINNEKELNDIINIGINNKKKYNNIKSHLIIELKIYRYYKDKNIMKYSNLFIAELEGMECCSKESEISEEQKVVNKSIDALKMIVKRLNDRNGQDDDEIHIPYRNSKLTRILSDCFGGNSYTSLILTCSKSEYHINQTKNLFIFGQNVRKIRNKPLINVEVNANKNSIWKGILFKENKIDSYNDDNENEINIYNPNKLNNSYQDKINEKKIENLNERINKLKNKNNKINLYNKYYQYNNNLEKENGELNNRALFLTKKLSDEITKNKKISEDNTILKSYTKTVINDLLIDKNYYLDQIDKNKKEIKEIKLLLKEKENKIQELNNDLNDKKSEILLIQLEKEKLSNRFEDKLFDKDEQIKNMEENISDERKRMENNLYTQIKNSEAIIRELREYKTHSEGLILKYKNNIEKLNLKIKELEIIHKNIIEEKENKSNDLELEINNYKIKISELTNDIFLKDSTIKKMNGEIQILKSELSNIKIINDSLSNKNKEIKLSYDEMQKNILSMKNKENDDKKLIDNYSLKIKDLQKELDNIKLKQNNVDNLNVNINNLEIQLKESNNIIDEYKNKYNLINNELNETKNIVNILNKEKENLLKENENLKKNTENIININKEFLILTQSKDKLEIKNKEQERELILLKKRIQNIEKDNEILREKMNDYEEIKMELECLKKRGNNYTYIEINKSSLKQNYDKLMEENKKLKENLIKVNENNDNN